MSDENPNLQPWIDPELEARVVAWVLGDASDFEAAEMERAIAENPELALFKRRIEAVHGLLAASAKLDLDPMRMAEPRRQELLNRLGGAPEPKPQVVVIPEKGKSVWRSLVEIAAVVAVLLFMAGLLMPALNSAKNASPKAAERQRELERKEELAEEEGDKAQKAAPAVHAQAENFAALVALRAQAKKDGSEAPDDLTKLRQPIAGSTFGFAQARPLAQDEARNLVPVQAPAAAPLNADQIQALEKMDKKIAALQAPDMSNMQNRAAGAGGEVSGANTYTGATTISAGSAAIPALEMEAAAPAPPQVPAEADATGAGAPVAAKIPSAGNGLADLNRSQVDVFGNYNPAQSKKFAGTLSSLGSLTVDQDKVLDMPVHKFGREVSPTAPSPIPAAQDEISAVDQPYSTFSLHVSDVSFKLAQQALAGGRMPDPASIRPEEFYNAFDYGDPAPAPNEKIACRIEQAAHPFLQQRNLVRIAMKVASSGRGAGQPLHLTVLLDTSGSMEREDRAASVQKAMEVLGNLLGPEDRVTLIGFAREPRLLADNLPGDQAAKLADIAKHTPPQGGTNMEEALRAAFEKAMSNFQQGAQNRVVMLTDGAANLGDADPNKLSQMVADFRQKGLSFDACGVGADGLNDDMLEALTRKGGGRYYLLKNPADADTGFARQLAGAFRPAAENVKMQVRFNPSRVGKYRLIGFEKHRLNQEDFRNDKVTAAQLAAEEAAVAVYQVQVLPGGEGQIGEVFVRFHDPIENRMVEQSWTIPYNAAAPALDKAAPSMQLAAASAIVAEKLRGAAAAEQIDMNALAPVIAQVRGHYPAQQRVQDFVTMFEQARRMTGR